RDVVGADNNDRQYVARLDEILQDVVVWNANRNQTRRSETLKQLQNILQSRFGWEIGVTPIGEIADFVHQRPKAIQRHLSVALDFALALEQKDQTQARRWLTDALQAIDSDTWRQQAREALAASDLPALEGLLQRVDVLQQSPALLYMFAS